MDESKTVCSESELLIMIMLITHSSVLLVLELVLFIIPREKWLIVCPLDVWWDTFALVTTFKGGREYEDGLYPCKGT